MFIAARLLLLFFTTYQIRLAARGNPSYLICLSNCLCCLQLISPFHIYVRDGWLATQAVLSLAIFICEE